MDYKAQREIYKILNTAGDEILKSFDFLPQWRDLASGCECVRRREKWRALPRHGYATRFSPRL